MQRLIIPASHQFPEGTNAIQLEAGPVYYHRDGFGRIIAGMQLVERDDPAKPGTKATFVYFATAPATTALPVERDADGIITAGWFLEEDRAVEGKVLKAPGNFCNTGESRDAASRRCLLKIGMKADPTHMETVYPFHGIGTQFLFDVEGRLVNVHEVDESLVLTSNNRRVRLTFEEMVDLAYENKFFGDDVNRLVMWVMAHNFKIFLKG